MRQGILGVYMREPLLDWQKEGRLLKDARTDSTQAADTAEDMHIAAKVFLPVCLNLQSFVRLCRAVACRVYACFLEHVFIWDAQPCRCRLQGTSCMAGIPLTFCWLSWHQSTPPQRTGRLYRSEARCCYTKILTPINGTSAAVATAHVNC